MKRQRFSFLLASVCALAQTVEIQASGRTRAIQELAEEVLKLSGKQAGKEALDSMSGRIARIVERFGDDGIDAIKKSGPLGLEAIEQSGKLAPEAVRVLRRYGKDAIPLVSRPSALEVVSKYGDKAADAIVRHGILAEKLITKHEKAAVNALVALSVGRSARRVGMLADDEAIQKTGRFPELLDVIAKDGEKAVDWIWRHRDHLGKAIILANFLLHVDEYLDGKRELPK